MGSRFSGVEHIMYFICDLLDVLKPLILHKMAERVPSAAQVHRRGLYKPLRTQGHSLATRAKHDLTPPDDRPLNGAPRYTANTGIWAARNTPANPRDHFH